jgi:O-antigen ligase/polysaccharide polymerase Wzy-like membrane protein
MPEIRNTLEGFCAPTVSRRWTLGPDGNAASRRAVGEEKVSGLRKVAFACLWLLVFTIPWEDAITISGFGTSARLVGVLAMGLGFLAIIERGSVRRPTAAHLMMFLFVILAGVSYLWSLFPEGTLAQDVTYVQLLTMVWLIWELCARGREQRRLMQAYVLGTCVSGADTLYRYLSHQESAYQRYAGARLDANDLGLMVALSIPVSYYLLITSKGKTVWVYRLQLMLAATTLLLTASRGAMLAALVALVIVPLTHARLTVRQRVAIVLTLVLLVGAAVRFVPASSWDRLSTVPNEFARGTLTGRTVIWKAGWELFRAHPFFGIGANAFRLMVSRIMAEPIRYDEPGKPPAPPAHNTFLSVLVEEGIVGLALFCGLLGVLVLSLRTMPTLQRRLWMVCLAAWVVGVSSLTWEMRKPTWFLFALLIAESSNTLQKRSVHPSQARVLTKANHGLCFGSVPKPALSPRMSPFR